MEKVTIIPPPKEVDPRVLAWKGAAVLAKMDGVSELWVTASDWVGQLFSVRVLLANTTTGPLRNACSERTLFLSLAKKCPVVMPELKALTSITE